MKILTFCRITLDDMGQGNRSRSLLYTSFNQVHTITQRNGYVMSTTPEADGWPSARGSAPCSPLDCGV